MRPHAARLAHRSPCPDSVLPQELQCLLGEPKAGPVRVPPRLSHPQASGALREV